MASSWSIKRALRKQTLTPFIFHPLFQEYDPVVEPSSHFGVIRAEKLLANHDRTHIYAVNFLVIALGRRERDDATGELLFERRCVSKHEQQGSPIAEPPSDVVVIWTQDPFTRLNRTNVQSICLIAFALRTPGQGVHHQCLSRTHRRLALARVSTNRICFVPGFATG